MRLVYHPARIAAIVSAGRSPVNRRTCKREPETRTAWLPTVGGRPLASSSLVAEPPENGVKTELAPWTVSVVRLAPEQAVDLLCASVDKATLAPGVVAGKPLAFWVNAMRFA